MVNAVAEALKMEIVLIKKGEARCKPPAFRPPGVIQSRISLLHDGHHAVLATYKGPVRI